MALSTQENLIKFISCTVLLVTFCCCFAPNTVEAKDLSLQQQQQQFHHNYHHTHNRRLQRRDSTSLKDGEAAVQHCNEVREYFESIDIQLPQHFNEKDNLYRKQVTEKILKEQGNFEVVVFSSYESAINEVAQSEQTTTTTAVEEMFIPYDMAQSEQTTTTTAVEEMFIPYDMAQSEQTTTTSSAEEVFVPNDLTPNGKDKLFWSESAVKLMLSKIQELRPKVGKSATVKSKQKMYSLVSECLAEKNILFTTTQIENKFRVLERQYKAAVLHNKKTGRSRQSCPFESELSQILGKKRSVVPEFTLDSSEKEGVSRSEALGDEQNSDTDQSMKDDIPSCSNRPAKRKRFSGPKEKLLQKVDELIKVKKEFHSKILEMVDKREERELEKEKRAKRKLELLEQLVAQNKS